LITGLALGLAANPAVGYDFYWDGNGQSPPSGYFNDPLNWNAYPYVPDWNDTAHFDLASAYYVTFDEDVETLNLMIERGNPIFVLESGTENPVYTLGEDLSVELGLLYLSSVDMSITDELRGFDGGYLNVQTAGAGPPSYTPSAVSAAKLWVNDGDLVVDEGASVSINGSGGGDFRIGYGDYEPGQMFISEGGQVTSAGDVRLGYYYFSEGLVAVSGAGSTLSAAGWLSVGDYIGQGQLTIEEGGHVACADASFNRGSTTVTGAGSTCVIADWLAIGYSSQAELVIADGGVVSNSDGCMGCIYLGEPENPWGMGDVTVEGVGSTWTIAGSFDVAGAAGVPGGIGELTVRDGGTVEVGDTLTVWDSDEVANQGTVNVEGGLLRAGEIDLSSGTLNLSGGRIIADVLDACVSDATFNFTGGKLSVGEYHTNMVNQGGTLAPGDPIGVTYVGLRYTQDAGKLQIEITGPDPNQNEYDRVIVGHTARLNGGDLEVVFRGYVPGPDDEFVILTANAGIEGEFDNAARYVDIVNGGGARIVYSRGNSITLSDYQYRFPCKLAANTTGQDGSNFVGPPDNHYAGITDQHVDYDLGALCILDGEGPDFNVYELAAHGVEFDQIDVLVSADGVTWISVKPTEGPVVRIPGDEGHTDDAFARSYDLAGSGLAVVRYVRVKGTWYTGGNGFDLDAIGAVHVDMWCFPSSLSANTTGQDDAIFIGPPDDQWVGIGGQIVEYDLGDLPVIDKDGPDFNIYEVDFGGPDFHLMDVLVSADGLSWVSVDSTEGPVERIPGDEAHSDDAFARSYDLAGSGLSAARYIRIDGEGDGPAGGSAGFDLDAIGAIHVPPAWLYQGDLDGDGDVDLGDLTELLAHYGMTQGATYEDGDLDGDGDVDLSDLTNLLANYGAGS
jgi:T5SS/PEP-CTERM-associated repeat protein